ncbi:MAG: beta-ketoacyl-ACP synthase II [Candidatus Xenobia bacterium]
MAKRVVVTGLGVLSPVGIGWQNYWKNLVEGQSGIGPITQFDATGYDSRIAGEVKGFVAEEYLDRKDARKFDRFLQFAVAASRLALQDSGLQVTEETGPRTGVIIGSGIGGMITFEGQHKVLLERGPGKISPFFIPTMIANMAAGTVGIQFGLKGPNMAIVTACATGASSIGAAFDCIRLGRADAMLAGGVEATITPMAVAGFCAMKAMSTRNDAPQAASRPFDRGRDGFVIAEGAGVLVLESLESAQARGANVYAEVVGYGSSADAYHLSNPDPNGGGVGRAMQAALLDAGLSPDAIDHINAHATSTPAGDKTESRAVQSVYGDHARHISISATKSMTGHALGAAGALESVAAILATHDDVVPPTINYEQPDPECELDYTPNVARRRTVRYAMNDSFGFGGQNSILIFKKHANGAAR